MLDMLAASLTKLVSEPVYTHNPAAACQEAKLTVYTEPARVKPGGVISEHVVF